MSEYERGFAAGYGAAHRTDVRDITTQRGRSKPKARSKPKRKPSKSNSAYGKAFRKIQGKYKKKSGGWKKDGFKRCAAAARRMVK